jgi:hypothetical protein
VGRVYVGEHVFASAEDGACQAHGVPAMHDILWGADHHDEAIVDVVSVVVVDERDVDVDL